MKSLPLRREAVRLAVEHRKPGIGEPCNGCGICCMVIPCEVAQRFLGATEGPCPALERDEGRTWCGMVRNPTKHLAVALGLDEPPAEAAALVDAVLGGTVSEALGVGSGCDSYVGGYDDPVRGAGYKFEVLMELMEERR